MRLKLDACGIEINLQIHGYAPSIHAKWDEQWCRVDFSFTSEGWLNYHKKMDEVLLCCEVERLAEMLQKQLQGGLKEITQIDFIEPDFRMILSPERDLRNDPKYLYIQKGYEIQDIYTEWRVYFWNEGLTDNYLTVTLVREDIEMLLTYLLYVTRKLNDHSPEVTDLANQGFLIR